MNISEMSTKLRLLSLSWREMSRTVKRLIHQLAELPVMDLLISERYKRKTIVEIMITQAENPVRIIPERMSKFAFENNSIMSKRLRICFAAILGILFWACTPALENIGQYDNVFIGGPVWWAEPPMILHTFCETYPELKDKTLIPFGTHGGSGVGSYKTMLQKYYPQAKFLESLGISGSSVRSEGARTSVADWVKKLGLDKK